MSSRLPARVRRVLLQVHLWLGVGLGVLLVPVALTGTVLVFESELDAMLRPSLYAVTGHVTGAPLDTFVERAAAVVPGSVASNMRFSDAGPIVMMMRPAPVPAEGEGRRARGPEAARSGPPRAVMVYLDPPTATVLGVAAFGDSLVGLVHRFHENLLLPQWGGRSVVGWIGFAMFALCITGIWVWWPRNASFVRGLRWRRGPSTNDNLHHAFGFWAALPLALLSLTGVYLAFPAQGRAILGSIAGVSPPPERSAFASPVSHPALGAQAALDAGLSALGGGRPVSLAMPTSQNRSWQVQVADANGAIATASIDDGTGSVRINPSPPAGDAIASWLRRVHEGSHHGWLWQAIAALTGLTPALFFVTGLSIWLAKRRAETRRRALRGSTRVPTIARERVST